MNILESAEENFDVVGPLAVNVDDVVLDERIVDGPEENDVVVVGFVNHTVIVGDVAVVVVRNAASVVIM